MIKANELRMGNWVKPTRPRYGERFIKVESVGLESVNIAFREYGIVELEPIPLTPEILEKCGFVKDEQHECYVIWQSESNVAIEYFDGEVHLVGKSSAEPINNCIYLHQLQNLIYALTGEELQIDLQ